MNGLQGLKLIIALVSAAALAFALTIIYLGMRAVMDVGGFCAEGGPYVIAVHCPDNITWLLPVAIFGGLFAAAVYRASAPPAAGRAVLLAWSALFLSLGWNFLDYGIGLTGGDGIQPGALIPGIMFVIMGGAPLFVWIPQLVRAAQGKEPPAVSQRVPASLHVVRPGSAMWPTTGFARATSDQSDVVGELERLASLHRQGELSDAEYESAKHAALGGAPS